MALLGALDSASDVLRPLCRPTGGFFVWVEILVEGVTAARLRDELPAERVARLRDLLFVAGGLEPDALKRVSTTSSDDSDDEVFVKPRKRRLGR